MTEEEIRRAIAIYDLRNKKEDKYKNDLSYWKTNAEEDYIKTPISVLRYIHNLEEKILREDNSSTFWICLNFAWIGIIIFDLIF
jgi:hypothetical protein